MQIDLRAMFEMGVGWPGAAAAAPSAPARPTRRPRTTWASPAEARRFAAKMAAKGSTPAGLKWFLGDD